jgi:hypothetical protein
MPYLVWNDTSAGDGIAELTVLNLLIEETT